MTVFLGTLWISVKQVKSPYVFDGELGIALDIMQWIRASSHGEWEVSCLFSSWGRILRYILELRRGWPLKTAVASATSRLLSCYVGHLRNLFEAWQGNRDPSLGEAGDPGSLSSCHRDIGAPINFHNDSGIVTF